MRTSLVVFFLSVITVFTSCSHGNEEVESHDVITLHDVLSDPSKDEIRVGYLGGSITLGSGASNYSKCFAILFEQELKEKYGKKISVLNYGIGATSSELGMFRVASLLRDKPDVVFVEFSVNDKDLDSTSVFYNHENIYRLFNDANVPVVSLNLNTENGQTAYHSVKKVLGRYDIPDVRVEMLPGEFVDGIHPNDKGHQKISDSLVAKLDVLPFLKHDFSNPLTKFDFDTADFILPDLTTIGWVKGEDFKRLDYSCETSKANDTLNFEFEGNCLWLVNRRIRTELIKNSTFLIKVDSADFKEYKFTNNPSYNVITPFKVVDE